RLTHEGDEQFAVGSAIKACRCLDSTGGHGRDRTDHFPVPVRHLRHHPHPWRSAAVSALHRGGSSKLVEENKLIHTHVGELLKPVVARQLHVGPILLGGMRGLFFRGRFSRASVRLTVAGCAGFLIASATSASVASGLRLISSRIFCSSASS